ncbi:response regulator [Thalassovita sp.]|uniref:response regulator n=1 Tax=Thalassovita sp. TaxID=1979401 RepID=UPI0029DE81AB|nr:response regulator [Thalassovita sp.]
MTALPSILHVEDDPDIREIARLALEVIGGLTVVQCETGTEALTRAADIAPDLLLLDMTMPDMDGVETLTALRALPGFGAMPAIFMTARAQIQEHEALMAQGANAVISKPFDAMTLADEIRVIWNALP